MKMTAAVSILWKFLIKLRVGGIKRIWSILSKLETMPENYSPAHNTEAPTSDDFLTIALFGVDRRRYHEKLNGCNADCIIIVSIEKKTKKLKALSVYRDTMMNTGDGYCCKANEAYSHVGPEYAVSMLNRNFDLRIRHYVTADFKAFTILADCVGGVEVPLSYNEICNMNEPYIRLAEEETGYSYSPIPLPEVPEDKDKPLGDYRLDGLQTTTYCRIRSTSNFDMGRTSRQREVLSQLIRKLQNLPSDSLAEIAEKLLPLIQTSLSKREMLRMLPLVLQCRMDASAGFPVSFRFSQVLHSCVSTELADNVKKLHLFLYDRHDYEPSAEVEKNSLFIHEYVLKEESRLLRKRIKHRNADSNRNVDENADER